MVNLTPADTKKGGSSKMKKIICSVVLALVLCEGPVARALPEQGVSPPDIAFSEELWDFGVIEEGDVVTHVFEVKNLGGTELVISKVRPSCGCTAALVSSAEIAPGGSSQNKVSFNSSGLKGKTSKYIYVESNDPDEPVSKLTITAIVEAPPQPTLELMENSWDLGLIIQGERPTYILSVKNTGEQELVLGKVRTSPRCTAKLLSPKNIAPGKMGKISISYDSAGRKGLAREYLYIDSNDPSEETIVFRITGYIIEPKPELTISPISLNLGTIKEGEKCTAIIKLRNWGEKKIKIVNTNSSSKLITLTPPSTEIDPGEETKINVSLNPGEETGQMEEYLYITIALPLEAVIQER